MIKWHFGADSEALLTGVGTRSGGIIHVEADSGLALYGPFLELPAGKGIARLILREGASGNARIAMTADRGATGLAERAVALDGTVVELPFAIAETTFDIEIRLSCEGPVVADIVALEIDLMRDRVEDLAPDRPVGQESAKTFAAKIESGFIAKYLSGPAVLEVGYRGYAHQTVPIVPQAIGLDLGYPGYTGTHFPFADASMDAIYSSHCFEHVGPYRAVLRDWYRLLKVGGFLIIVVPHQHMFEKRTFLPSRGNYDHKRYYTGESLLRELGESFAENSYRIRHLRENDEGFNYSGGPRDPSYGCYEIELVVEKIAKPNWNSDDQSIRPFSASEFDFDGTLVAPWAADIDLNKPARCVVWGPYVNLRPARYEAEFWLLPLSLPADLSDLSLSFVVVEDEDIIAQTTLRSDGLRRMLERGRMRLPFTIAEPGHNYQFRIHQDGSPLDARIRFKGVVPHYARDPVYGG